MRNHRLGLDTEAERSRALEMARRAFENASVPGASPDLVTFTLGYLAGIADLAKDEGADDLARSVAEIAGKLK
jgi:hypothetical protein